MTLKDENAQTLADFNKANILTKHQFVCSVERGGDGLVQVVVPLPRLWVLWGWFWTGRGERGGREANGTGPTKPNGVKMSICILHPLVHRIADNGGFRSLIGRMGS